MRAGFITPALTVANGWGRYTLALVSALSAAGVEAVLVVAADSPGDGGLPHAGYYPILPPLQSGRRWVTPRALLQAPRVRRLVRDCDLVHCTAEPFAPPAALAGRPLVITAHGTYLPLQVRRRGIGWLFARAARRATVVCVSAYTEAQVRAEVPGVRTVVVHNGVDWARFATPAPAPEPRRGPVILGVGQVKPRKGFHIVAEAMQAVRAAHPDAEYVIVGAADASDLAAQLRATPGVRLLGRLSDDALRAWYHHADVFAMTPVSAHDRFEGFGLVYLEAGAAGLPAVAARGSGAEEAVIDGETGLLVPPNDPGATAAAILRLLDDPTLRARLADGARRHAQAHGWDRVAAQVLDLYQQIGRQRP